MTTVQGWTFDIISQGSRIDGIPARESTVSYDRVFDYVLNGPRESRSGTLTTTLVPHFEQTREVTEYVNWICNNNNFVLSTIVMWTGNGSYAIYKHAVLMCHSYETLGEIHEIATYKLTWRFTETEVVAIPPRELRRQRPPLQKLDWRSYGF